MTDAPGSPFLALPTAALVANLLVFELFKHATGAGPIETHCALIAIELETALSRRHVFQPHPLCRSCQRPVPLTQAAFRDAIARLEAGAALEDYEFSQRLASCFDDQLGIFTALTEGDAVQVPFSQSAATVSNPMCLDALDHPIRVRGTGAGFAAARRAAGRRACEVYAASLVDVRRLPSAAAAADDGELVHLGRLGLPAHEGATTQRTWAYDLQRGTAFLIPAEPAFPALTGIAPIGDAGLGVGSGMSWDEALCNSMLDLCQHLTLARMRRAVEPFPQVDLDATALEPEGTRQRHLLAVVSDWVTVYDVTCDLGVPTFAICMDDTVMAYSTHPDVARSLRTGFERALQRYQYTRWGGSAEGAADLPQLDPAQRGRRRVVPRSVTTGTWAEWRAWLARVLQQDGWQILVVPLDHDPALMRVLPYVARVLLARDHPNGR